MAYSNLFSECLENTLSGIKNIKLMVLQNNETTINFPIDVVLETGTNIITGYNDILDNQIVIGDQKLIYTEPEILNSSFEEIVIKDRRGKYYQQTVNIQYPKLSISNNLNLVDILRNKNAVILIRDNNDIDWIGGYDLPLRFSNIEMTIDNNDNFYNLSFISTSYEKFRRFNYVSDTNDYLLINTNDYLFLNTFQDRLII